MYDHLNSNKYNWKNWRLSIQQNRKLIIESLKPPEPCELVNDYTSQSSVHGLRYVSNIKASIIEKVFWVGALMICTLAACLLAGQLWKRYLTIPTVLVVKDTHLPLYLFPFPSITVCPANKVKKSVAMEYFSRYMDLDEEDDTKENLLHVISAFSMMQQPTYFRMKPHVRKSQHLLPYLKDINVTDFMLTTLPKCSEVFAVCNWHGEEVNCCDVFSLQRTEEGFCYAFNSLTSEGGKHCPLSEVLENEGIVEEDDIMYEGCQLRRNTAVGTVTGLEVFVYKANESETLEYGQKDLNGIRVIVHTSYEYPNAGDGIWVKEEQRKRVSITTYPAITVTSDNVKNLEISKRGCVFPDEMDLHVYHVYTESSCLIECRFKYIASRCNCYMYYFPPPDDEKPICGTLHLECIVIHAPYMRLQRPPENTPGFNKEDMRRSLNCSHCIPTCYETEHDLEVDFLADSHWLSRVYYGHLDVAYGNLGATKYQRDITFTWTDLLVSLGGVANLFLGFSLLSVVEFIYWVIKIALIVIWKHYKRRQKLKKIVPLLRLKYSNDSHLPNNIKK